MPKAIIFDMDGVIFDSEVIARDCWRKVFSDYGYEFTDAIYKKLIGRSMPAAYQILTELYGSDLPINEMSVKQGALWQDATHDTVRQKAGVAEILDYLKSINIPCAVGSSTSHVEVEERLQNCGLRDYFQVVVGGDYVEHAKPAPDIFLKCAEYLKVAPKDCLVIEDSNNGLRAAKTAGIPAVMIPDLLPADEIDDDIHFVEFSSLLDLLAHIKTL